MLFQDALEVARQMKEDQQLDGTFIVVPRPSASYFSGIQVYEDDNVRIIRIGTSAGRLYLI